MNLIARKLARKLVPGPHIAVLWALALVVVITMALQATGTVDGEKPTAIAIKAGAALAAPLTLLHMTHRARATIRRARAKFNQATEKERGI